MFTLVKTMTHSINYCACKLAIKILTFRNNNYKHYTNTMSLPVKLECRPDSSNGWSGLAQSAESVYARITSHYSNPTNALL